MPTLENTDRVHDDLTPDQALLFIHKLRVARAEALADAEGWQGLIFVFEHLVKFVTRCQKTTIGNAEATIVFLSTMRRGQRSGCLDDQQLELLLQQVVNGRNSEFHGGAAARRFARHCVEFSFLLEDGLLTFMKQNLGTVMSSPVCCVETWQMLADVRRLMLDNAFTWVPVRFGETWWGISDHALLIFLEKDRKSLLTKTVDQVLPGSGSLDAPVLKIFNQSTETSDVNLLNALTAGPVLVSTENESPNRIVGIVTAVDLL